MPKFISPPYPSSSSVISPDSLEHYEKQGAWIAQRKFNGSHAVIWIYQDQIAMWNRQGIPFSTYQLTPGMKQCFLNGLERDYNTEYVLNGELLHKKAVNKITKKQAVENVIVLFDILFAGKYLSDLTTLERFNLLKTIAIGQGLEPKKRAIFVTNYEESQIWLAEQFEKEFSYYFWEVCEIDDKNNDLYPEIEGLILKKKTAKNIALGNRTNRASWMLKCRKPKENMYQL